ncbi:NAD(P)-dependent alcohol dehydrogenase [Pseudonocardia pini]|uniref:NAD(P)-dependent alcohol dehydrogenase n=1 Tax=Pseudonocardia pini TaxID=2758030 RepID=UPI0015EFE4C3|nr:NAD(P)-dependent alcohol dehydrogenase [Pseudonocardia pini]
MPSTVTALAVPGAGKPFERTTITRRDPRPHDVVVEIAYCGICHSDIHQARGEWYEGIFPMVPGHEIAGTVTAVGGGVTRFAVGDRVGVGCFVDSCRECESCRAGEEQYCARGEVGTYAARDHTGEPTYGGYSRGIVVDEDYVLRIPDGLGLDVAAPLLCAGITVYSPLVRWGVGPGSRVAVVGMGGLGHLAVQIAAALGAEVTVLSQTLAKEADGLRLGAVRYAATADPETLPRLRSAFDLVLSTVSATQDLDAHLALLRVGGTLVNVGLPPGPASYRPYSLAGGRRTLAGSKIGGIRETQQMLDFCAERGLGAEIETVSVDEVDGAYDRVVTGDVRYRFVIDVAGLGEAG